jgi:hypothetical protein
LQSSYALPPLPAVSAVADRPMMVLCNSEWWMQKREQSHAGAQNMQLGEEHFADCNDAQALMRLRIFTWLFYKPAEET